MVNFDLRQGKEVNSFLKSKRARHIIMQFGITSSTCSSIIYLTAGEGVYKIASTESYTYVYTTLVRVKDKADSGTH